MRLHPHRLILLCAAAALLLLAARAEARPLLPDLSDVDAYLFPGVKLGGTTHVDGGSGFTIGGEISGGLVTRYKFLGVLSDLVYDAEQDAARMLLGAEVGIGPVGMDGGLLMVFKNGVSASGGVVGLFFSVGVAHVYGRYGRVADSSFVEYGVGFKLPLHRIFWLSGDADTGVRKETRWRLWP